MGIGEKSELLRVISSQGRGVFDCTTGEKVARDYDDAGFQDTCELTAMGIGPLENQLVRTTGLHGGGLALGTDDGWTVEDFVLAWPDHALLLVPSGSWAYGDAYNKTARYTKIGIESEVRAWRLSPSGKSLVLATSGDVTICQKGHFRESQLMKGFHPHAFMKQGHGKVALCGLFISGLELL